MARDGAERRCPRCGTRRAKATTNITTNVRRCGTTSEIVRPMSTADGYIGSERRRSMIPLLQVVGDADAGERRVEQHGLGEDAGDHVLLVVVGGIDRAAEHVHEQHDEHDRLDRGEDQQLGVAGHRPQVAHGLGPAVLEQPDRPVGISCSAARARGRACRVSVDRRRSSALTLLAARRRRRRPPSAAWPVRAKNTSSSVAWRTATSATGDAGVRRAARTDDGHDARRRRRPAR